MMFLQSQSVVLSSDALLHHISNGLAYGHVRGIGQNLRGVFYFRNGEFLFVFLFISGPGFVAWSNILSIMLSLHWSTISPFLHSASVSCCRPFFPDGFCHVSNNRPGLRILIEQRLTASQLQPMLSLFWREWSWIDHNTKGFSFTHQILYRGNSKIFSPQSHRWMEKIF